VLESEDEYLAVADLAGLGRGRDRLDHLVDLIGRHGDLDLEFRKEGHRIFGAAIDLGVSLLASVAFDLRDGQALHAHGRESVAHLVQFERLDDGHYDFHGWFP
jgi:hypothetical protein